MRDIFCGEPVSLQQILDSRSHRARQQREWLQKGGECIVSFSMNIPGARKQFPLARRAFMEGWKELLTLFSKSSILESACSHKITGSEGFLRLSVSPSSAKSVTIFLEENHPLGRLFDMDVIGTDGLPYSRSDMNRPPRLCLVCNQNAKLCARSQAHSSQELKQHISELLLGYFREQDAERCGMMACRALLYEVSVTPKPGLVDRANSGSHRDMNFYTFLDSSTTLAPWFSRMFRLGWDNARQPAREFFPLLRRTGKRAESAMFASTKGINTHKGLVFSLGILCGALGRLMATEELPLSEGLLRRACSELGRCSLDDFSRPGADTAGLRHYHQGLGTGVRGQAAEGFPLVWQLALPSLQRRLKEGLCLNAAAAITLLTLIGTADDTNMYHRGGEELAAESRRQANDLLKAITPENFEKALSELDEQYIRRHLSPGGCADLLALTFMIHFLLEEHWLQTSDYPIR